MIIVKAGVFLSTLLICQAVQAAPDNAPASPESAGSMSAADERLVRILVRKDMVGELVSMCSTRFPDIRSTVQQANDNWVSSQKQDLDKAAVVMLMRSSPEDAKRTSEVAGEESGKLQVWTHGKLGIARDKAPEAADCLKIANGLRALADSVPAKATRS